MGSLRGTIGGRICIRNISEVRDEPNAAIRKDNGNESSFPVRDKS